MISQILQDKSFAAGAVCTDGQDAVLSVLRVLAMLISERAVSAGAFSTGAKTEEAIKETNIVIPVRGREFFNIRVTAPTEGGSSGSHAPARRPSASQAAKAHRNMGTKKFTGTRTETREKTSSFFSPRGIVRMTQAGADAHAAFLRVFEQAANAFAQQTGFQMGLLEKLPSFGDGVTLRNFRKDEKISEEKIEGQSRALEGVPIRSGNQNSENAPMPDESGIAAVQDVQAMSKKIAAVQDVRAMSKKMCMEFAVGSIAKTLGAEFAQVDTHPTRVRLPDEPLMLADRILDIQGEARSMGSGKVITEHDVLEGAWYLDSGRIPTCIAVEAGQADLFLSGYLGIDFETKGLAVYRLLDAVVTFHAELPRPGTVIHYAIEIQHFFKQGDTWLFRFRFDATVDGRLFLTMREGCAGFFSQAALDAGQGIVKSRLDKRTLSGTLPKDWQTLVPMAVESIDEGRLEALRDGDLATAFGAAFAGLPLQRPLTIPGGRMRLVHRVMQIEPHGGRFNIGFIRAEADIRPDDWFLTCHFVDDKVMPGTLMYECCMHTLRILLLRMGWTGETHETVCEPVPGVKSRLKCRGQVLDTTRTVTYEITLKELGYDPVPFAIADALMYADGKPIVEISDMSLRMSGLSRKILQKTWNSSRKEEKDKETGPGIKAAVYDSARIIAFCNGKPSEAFGAPYRIFDEERRIARLPRAPYQFLDRITAVEGEAFVMKAGAACEAQYDMRADAWYFGSNRQAHIPFSILLEIALQPCGWLAAYVGSALTSKTDLSFRNLGGDAVLHAPVIQADEVLTVRASLTEVSSSAGMIIQNFSFLILGQGRGKVYEGTTNFGFFTREALAKQVGVRNAKSYLSEALPAESERTLFPREAPFPDARMRMVEHIDVYMPEGGPNGLGLIRGSIDVDPAAWFFEAHFYQDPVWPGSLGLEGFLQLLKAVAARRWNTGPDTSFLTCPPGSRHHWIYRGQVIRSCKRVEIEAVITAADDERRHLTADGFLMADGRIIYEMKGFSLSINQL
ncbi:MAG: hypothetical protein GY862_20485 [Gammaproteobacteria bacterium]|nr:hypothetical protein [Gammaproteobacteria bacterium]